MAEIDFEFGRSIGATHYVEDDSLINNHQFMKDVDTDRPKCFVLASSKWYSAYIYVKNCKPIPPEEPEWTIYNNTLPLCELTDEQYGKLRRAADTGEVVQSLCEYGYGFIDTGLPTWINIGIYRIKLKSERELFIEKCGTMTPSELFDAGCRFTED